ncbi:MAG: hypothetical protein QXS02_05455 [Candidatus Thermoplasmatota archaeon]
MIKHTMLMLIVTGLLFSLAQLVTANPSIIVYDYVLYPEVLMPGDDAILTLTVKNAETTATRSSTSDSTTTTTMIGALINNIWITPDRYGNSKISANLNYEKVGYLAPGASIPLSFKLHVDSDMPNGVYFPIVRIDVETYIDVYYPIAVRVSNTTVNLIATDFPTKISYNGRTDIILTVVNNRPNTVEGVTVIPIVTSGMVITPSEQYIGSMIAGSSENIKFSLKPSDKGFCNLSFMLQYRNGDNLHSSVTTLSTEVIDTYDVAPIITSFPLSITKGGSSKIRLEVYNAKNEEITGVLVTPVCDAVVIPTQYFIGSMDPDDVFSASFDIFTDTVDYGYVTISFVVTYKQGNEYYQAPIVNRTFEVVKGPGVSYQSQSSTRSSGGTEDLYEPSLTMCFSTIVIVIVIILILVLILRWKKRRKA